MTNCTWCKSETENPKFCSLKCSTRHQAKIRREKADIPSKNCEQCGKSFSYGSYSGTSKTSKDRFCSRSCAVSANNKKRIRPVGSKPSAKCLNCGEQTKGWAESTRFCSTKCSSRYRFKEQREAFLGGDATVASCQHGLKRWARSLLLELANNACSKCGWDRLHPIDNLPLVEIDHIDGNHKNNHIDNLQVLCPNCHSMTPNHRARNWGKGRESRRGK